MVENVVTLVEVRAPRCDPASESVAACVHEPAGGRDHDVSLRWTSIAATGHPDHAHGVRGDACEDGRGKSSSAARSARRPRMRPRRPCGVNRWASQGEGGGLAGKRSRPASRPDPEGDANTAAGGVGCTGAQLLHTTARWARSTRAATTAGVRRTVGRPWRWRSVIDCNIHQPGREIHSLAARARRGGRSTANGTGADCCAPLVPDSEVRRARRCAGATAQKSSMSPCRPCRP